MQTELDNPGASLTSVIMLHTVPAVVIKDSSTLLSAAVL